MKIRRFLPILLAVVVLAGLAPAKAHDHRQPKAVLLVDGQRQVGSAYSSEWARADGKYCIASHGDGIPSWDPVVTVPAGPTEVRVRFGSRHRPVEVTVGIWRFSEPTGGDPPTETPAVTLRKVKRHGRTVAWEASFESIMLGDAYVDVFGKWDDVDDCGHQSMAWDFHLRGAI